MMSDDEFIAAFEAMAIPRDDWSHEAHVRMGWIYCQLEGDSKKALDRARSGIKALNKANNTPLKLYHETVTVAFMQLIWFRAQAGAREWPDFLRDNRDLIDKESPVLECYYTKTLLESERSHTEFVAPDKEALPV